MDFKNRHNSQKYAFCRRDWCTSYTFQRQNYKTIHLYMLARDKILKSTLGTLAIPYHMLVGDNLLTRFFLVNGNAEKTFSKA